MSDPFEDNRRRAEKYVKGKNLRLADSLGYGNQGTVFATDLNSAIKIHDREVFYHRELNVYLRLRDHNVSEICDCAVPTLIDFDDELWIIEMTIVEPPFLLDFASAYLDIPPDYPPEAVEEWKQDKQELFEDQWPSVRSILFQLECYGIYLYDVHPGNIRLPE